jgi:hypothetical protein
VDWSGVEWSLLARSQVDMAGLDWRAHHASPPGKKFLGRAVERIDEALLRLRHAIKVVELPGIVSCWDERVLAF